MAEIGEKLLAARSAIKEAIDYMKAYNYEICDACNGTGEANEKQVKHTTHDILDDNCWNCEGEGFLEL